MPELIAQHLNDVQPRWIKQIKLEEEKILGRLEDVSDFCCHWDNKISRRHAKMRWDGEKLHVQKFAKATNPIIYRQDEQDEFTVAISESFTIGGTDFQLVDTRETQITLRPTPQEEQFLDTNKGTDSHYVDLQ